MRRISRWPLLLTAFLTLSFGAAFADTTGAGLETLRDSAKNGDADAMLELGILYEFGYRMTDNKAPAFAWYRLAAENGNTKAGARQDALKPSMSEKDVEDANKIYNENVSTIRKQTPATQPVAEAPKPAEPAAPVAPAAPEPAPAPSSATTTTTSSELPTAASPTTSPVIKRDRRSTSMGKNLKLKGSETDLKDPQAEKDSAPATK